MKSYKTAFAVGQTSYAAQLKSKLSMSTMQKNMLNIILYEK